MEHIQIQHNVKLVIEIVKHVQEELIQVLSYLIDCLTCEKDLYYNNGSCVSVCPKGTFEK